MFPAPSPGTQALFQSLQANGTATPSTIDFHRTALNAAAARKGPSFNGPTTSGAEQDNMVQNNMEMKPTNGDNFAQHDATDAANGLFMLAKGAQHANNPFPQPIQQAAQVKRENNPNRASMDSTSARDVSEPSENGRDSKSKARGKKGAKAAPVSNNGKRKTEETPSKGNKRPKNENPNLDPSLEPDSDEDQDDDDEHMIDGKDTRKMTDEEKRKNFLERNR